MVMQVNKGKCLTCGGCVSICPRDAITLRNMRIEIDSEKCIECGICRKFCPVGALHLESNL